MDFMLPRGILMNTLLESPQTATPAQPTSHHHSNGHHGNLHNNSHHGNHQINSHHGNHNNISHHANYQNGFHVSDHQDREVYVNKSDKYDQRKGATSGEDRERGAPRVLYPDLPRRYNQNKPQQIGSDQRRFSYAGGSDVNACGLPRRTRTLPRRTDAGANGGPRNLPRRTGALPVGPDTGPSGGPRTGVLPDEGPGGGSRGGRQVCFWSSRAMGPFHPDDAQVPNTPSHLSGKTSHHYL